MAAAKLAKHLTGKVAIVTGAGRGIGRAIALALSREGARVVLAARNETELRAVAQEIRSSDGDALVLPTDVTQDEDMERLVQATLKEWSAIDILVNNAGWGKTVPVVNTKNEEIDQTLQINLRAPMILTRLVLPAMLAQKSGAIINMGSISGKAGSGNTAAYSASKFGVIGFTQSLFEEVREYGIKVSVILPGFVDTSLIPPNKRVDRGKMIRPEDVAETVMFVLSSPPTTCPVEITIRPQQTPYR